MEALHACFPEGSLWLQCEKMLGGGRLGRQLLMEAVDGGEGPPLSSSYAEKDLLDFPLERTEPTEKPRSL